MKRSFKDDVRPFITKLPVFPEPNSTTCSVYVTAECTRGRFMMSTCLGIRDTHVAFIAQYNIPKGSTKFPGNELGIFESLDDHYSKADLDVFFKTLYPYV